MVDGCLRGGYSTKPFGTPFPEYTSDDPTRIVADAIAKNETPSGDVLSRLRDGWSRQSDGARRCKEAEKAGEEWARTVPLQLDYKENERDVRDHILTPFGQIFPAPAMAVGIKKGVKTVEGGGGFLPGYPLLVATPMRDLSRRETSVLVMVHEGLHAYHYHMFAPGVKGIMTMEDTAAYRYELKRNILETAEAYFSLPWKAPVSGDEDARTFKNWGYLVPEGTALDAMRGIMQTDPVLNKILTDYDTMTGESKTERLIEDGPAYVSCIASRLGVELADAPPHPKEKLSLQSSWNGLAYLVGRKRMQLNDKEKLTDAETKFMQDPWVGLIGSTVLNDLGHYVVGPVQRYGGGFPRNLGGADNPYTILNLANQRVQEARLRFVSTIPSPWDYHMLGRYLKVPQGANPGLCQY